jgi:hypothetical protein
MMPGRLAGRLVLRPAEAPAVVCERPLVGAAALGRLTRGRRAGELPELLGAVFTLCAHAQRSTVRRAVHAALGMTATRRADDARAALATQLHVAREHLQRLALDLPTQAGGAPAGPHWLSEAPVLALPVAAAPPAEAVLNDIARALPQWLERQVFGMPPAHWLEQWRAGRGSWLAQWTTEPPAAATLPVARWLHGVRADAEAAAWPCRALAPLRAGEAGLRELAAAIEADARFAERPSWRGAPAETGPWTRLGHEETPLTAWDRLGARLADLARVATGTPLAHGALSIAEGTGIAWTEMARGLLVHWVQLEAGASGAAGAGDADSARVARVHVLAPTEWNFHAEGAFARWLAGGRATTVQVRLAAATLDPCLAFDIEEAAADA